MNDLDPNLEHALKLTSSFLPGFVSENELKKAAGKYYQDLPLKIKMQVDLDELISNTRNLIRAIESRK